MIPLYFLTALLLLVFLLGAIGRLVQAQDDLRFELLFESIPSCADKLRLAREALLRAHLTLALAIALLLAWAGWLACWLVWGKP